MAPDPPGEPPRRQSCNDPDVTDRQATDPNPAASSIEDPSSAGAASVGQEPTWRSHLDLVEPARIEGWAQEADRKDPLLLRIYDNGIPIGDVVADRYRPDLADAGIGDGRHAFALVLPHALSVTRRHVIDVRRADDGRPVRGSPRVIEPDKVATPAVLQNVPGASWSGRLDHVTRERIEGWAWDERTPDLPLSLRILDNGEIIGRVLANRSRPDLAEAGIGDGRHAFTFIVPGGLSPLIRHIVQVIGESDGCEMPGSPVVLEASGGFDAALKTAVSGALAGLASAPERADAVDFLAQQLEHLLQDNANEDSKAEARVIHRQLQRRWGRVVATENPGAHKRALIIDDYLPSPDQDAGSVAILSHLQALQTMGYEVSFVAAAALALASDQSRALEARGIQCCCLPFYASVEEVLRRQHDCFDVIYLHRVTNASLYLGLARQYGGHAYLVYGIADLHFLRLARQAKVQDRPELMSVGARVQQRELLCASAANAVITHSEVEAALLGQHVKGCNVHVVPWSVPVSASTPVWSDRRDIAFIGNFAHSPNPDAARLLVRHIMPRVWAHAPALKCLLVGSHMVDTVRQLADDPRIDVVGQVPRLDTLLDRVQLTVAPLRFGAGVKGKVLDSLAAGVPCVMTPVAAEGIALPPDLQTLVVDDASRMAATIVRLTEDAEEWRRLSQSALAFIAANYSEARVVAALQAALSGARAATCLELTEPPLATLSSSVLPTSST